MRRANLSGPYLVDRGVELLLFASGPISNLVTAPILARMLGPAMRGEYGGALAICGISLSLAMLGQAELLMARARRGHQPSQTSAVIVTAACILGAVVGLLVLVASGTPLAVALCAVVWLPLQGQVNLWRSMSLSVGQVRPAAAAVGVASLLRTFGLALMPILDIHEAIYAILITQSTVCVGAFLTTWRASRRINVTGHTRGQGLPLLRLGLPIALFDVLTAVTLKGDVVALQVLSTKVELGLYTAVTALTAASLSLSASFKNRAQAATVGPGGYSRVRTELVQLLGISGVLAIAGEVLAPLVVTVLFGNSYVAAVPLMRICIISALGLVALDVLQGVLSVLGERKRLLIVGVIGALVCSTLSAVGAVVGGSEGVAVGVAVAYAAAAGVAWWHVRAILGSDGISNDPGKP